MNEKIVNSIKERRSQLGWTQEELAKHSGVSRQSIISIERGKYIPSLPLAFRFARLFECTIDDLFQLEE